MMTMPTGELQEALRQRMAMLDAAHTQLETMGLQQAEEGRQLEMFAEQCSQYQAELSVATDVARHREQATYSELNSEYTKLQADCVTAQTHYDVAMSDLKNRYEAAEYRRQHETTSASAACQAAMLQAARCEAAEQVSQARLDGAEAAVAALRKESATTVPMHRHYQQLANTLKDELDAADGRADNNYKELESVREELNDVNAEWHTSDAELRDEWTTTEDELSALRTASQRLLEEFQAEGGSSFAHRHEQAVGGWSFAHRQEQAGGSSFADRQEQASGPTIVVPETGTGDIAGLMTCMIRMVAQNAEFQAKSLEAQAAQTAALTASFEGSGDQHKKLLETLTDASREAAAKSLGDKPRLTASSADGLRQELKKMKMYFNDSKVSDRRTWLKTMRNLVNGDAATELEYYIKHELGGENAYQDSLLKDDSNIWIKRWEKFEARLKQAVHLDNETELNAVIRQYGNVRLTSKTDPHAVQKFLVEYRQARGDMIECGLLDDNDSEKCTRELEDFKNKIHGSKLWEWLLDLPDFPRVMESEDLADSRQTLLGRCRQYCRSRCETKTGRHGQEESLLKNAVQMTRKQKESAKKAERDKEKAAAAQSAVCWERGRQEGP